MLIRFSDAGTKPERKRSALRLHWHRLEAQPNCHRAGRGCEFDVSVSHLGLGPGLPSLSQDARSRTLAWLRRTRLRWMQPLAAGQPRPG